MSKEKKPIGHLVSDDKKVKIPIHGFGIYRTCLLPQKGKLLLNKPMPKQKTIEWEKKFDKLFIMPPYFQPTEKEPIYDLDIRKQEIKSFIHSLLKQERERHKQAKLETARVNYEAGRREERSKLIKEIEKHPHYIRIGDGEKMFSISEILKLLKQTK